MPDTTTETTEAVDRDPFSSLDSMIDQREAVRDEDAGRTSEPEQKPDSSADRTTFLDEQRKLYQAGDLTDDNLLSITDADELGVDLANPAEIRAALLEREAEGQELDAEARIVASVEGLNERRDQAVQQAMLAWDQEGDEEAVWQAYAATKSPELFAAVARDDFEFASSLKLAHGAPEDLTQDPATILDQVHGIVAENRAQENLAGIGDAIAGRVEEYQSDPRYDEEATRLGSEWYLEAIARNPNLAPTSGEEARNGLDRAVRHAVEQKREETQPDPVYGRSTLDPLAEMLAVVDQKAHERAYGAGETEIPSGTYTLEQRIAAARQELISPERAAARASRDPNAQDPLIAELERSIAKRTPNPDPEGEAGLRAHSEKRRADFEIRRYGRELTTAERRERRVSST